MTVMLIVIIAFGLIFDFINGFHDSANSIATIVSTKVLTPFQAVLWAGFFNFVAYFIFRDHKVANTVASIVHPQFVDLRIVIAGLIAAISWNLATWWFGIPSSSSHTLIGGFAGAGITNALYMGSSALSAINMHYILTIIAYIVLAPVIGSVVGYMITILILHICKNVRPAAAERWFKVLQLI